MSQRIIGIDLAVTAIHKAMIFSPASGQFIGRQVTFRGRTADLDRLLRRAKAGAQADVELIAILEATGMAWYPVAVYLEQKGVKVYRVNGQKTRDLRQALWKHTSSDRIDCRVLAQLYLLDPQRLTRCPLPDGSQLALQRACRADNRWRELTTAMQNRLQALDAWAWDGLHKLVPKVAQRWMRTKWYNPWQVQAAGATMLIDEWQAVAPASAAQNTEWIDAWVSRAQDRTALFGSEAMVGFDQLQATQIAYLAQIDDYAAQRHLLLNSEIKPLYTQLYPSCPLTSLMGVGLQSAATYRAFIGDINRFPTIERFRRWTGMVPYSRQSGTSEAKGLPLTKAGPSLIKLTLYLNAEVARQFDVQIAALYQRQMVDYGKHHSQAVCACASHLANRIYALLTQHRTYELRDLEGNPISTERSRELALALRVPDAVRQRNNKHARHRRVAQHTEARTRRREQSR